MRGGGPASAAGHRWTGMPATRTRAGKATGSRARTALQETLAMWSLRGQRDSASHCPAGDLGPRAGSSDHRAALFQCEQPSLSSSPWESVSSPGRKVQFLKEYIATQLRHQRAACFLPPLTPAATSQKRRPLYGQEQIQVHDLLVLLFIQGKAALWTLFLCPMRPQTRSRLHRRACFPSRWGCAPLLCLSVPPAEHVG